MSFNNTCRQVTERRSVSHAWIALHRVVEAYARSAGLRFSVVFAELEERFGFERAVPSRWPGLETMQAAARLLRQRRDAMFQERSALVASRRAEKRRGRRVPVAPDLVRIEHRSILPAPPVGYWGWRKRRVELALRGAATASGEASSNR